MPYSIDNQGLVLFSEPPISVDDEACALTSDVFIAIIQHLEALLNGDRNFRHDRVWKFYRGVPLFIAEISGELMVYAVEDLGDVLQPACKVSVMFAGVRNVGCVAGIKRWDGRNDEVLWSDIVLPRCQRHFR
jgi:hypothetical protein